MVLQERKKIFILGSASSYGTKIVSIIVGLVSVPIGLHYFGPVRYGIWAVISSVIAYLNISNLGIPTATTALTAKASKTFEQWAILRRSLFLLLISSAIVLSVVLGIVYFYPNWVVALGKIPSNLQNEAAEAAVAISILFLLNLPLTVFSAGFIGLQKIYWERFYVSLTTIAGLVALILVVLLKGNLVTLALFRGMAILCVGIITAIHFSYVNSGFCRKPSKQIGLNNEFSIKSIFTSGIRFFVIGIAAMVVWNTDNLVISHFIGPKAVTPYAVTFRLFTTVFVAFMAVNSVLWPMYGRASALNQWEWIQRTYDRVTFLLPVVGGLVWIGGVVFAKEIINLWVGSDAYGGTLVVFALGGYGYILSMVNIHAGLLSGLNATKNMVFIGWAEAITNLGISIALVVPLGIGGVALGTFLASLLTVCWMLPLDVHKQTGERVKFHFYRTAQHAFLVLVPCLIASILIQQYWQNEISKIFTNIIIIGIYLILSWRIMPLDLRNLVKNALTGLRTRIKIAGVLTK